MSKGEGQGGLGPTGGACGMGAIDPSDYGERVVELVYQPWTIEVKPYDEGGYFGRVVELPGCMTEADSPAELIEALEEARAEWIAAALDQGIEIPTPFQGREFSGKIFVRTSPELHRLVAEEAAKQGVSMSQWAAEILAEAVGVRDAIGKSGRMLFDVIKDAMASAREAVEQMQRITDEQKTERQTTDEDEPERMVL